MLSKKTVKLIEKRRLNAEPKKELRLGPLKAKTIMTTVQVKRKE